MHFLNRTLIKWRIFGGFGLIVALGVGMAIYGVWALAGVGGDVTKLSALSENTVRVLTTSRVLESMRRGATRYASAADPALVKEFTDNLTKAEELVKASAKATLSQERLRLYNSISDELAQHRGVFDQLVKSVATAEENRAKLFSGGDELSAATNKLVEAARASGNATVAAKAADVDAGVLLVRVANWRFLATSDPKGPATFQTNVGKASAAIEALQSAAGSDVRTLIGPVTARPTRRASKLPPRQSWRVPISSRKASIRSKPICKKSSRGPKIRWSAISAPPKTPPTRPSRRRSGPKK
jgi:hypothetical protein